MKETIITAKRKITELITFLICFIVANLANLYSIISYKTSFIELITSIGYVTVAALILYVIWTAIRLAIYGIRSIFNAKKVK